jgi:hypothetical protein
MNFDVSRLRLSDRVIGIGAIAVFIFLFIFKWYGVSSSGPLGGASFSANGWHSFTNSRWIWLITIVVALGSVAISAGALKLESPVQLGLVVAGLGALSTLLIFYRIVHHPSGGATIPSIAGVHYSFSYGIKIGIWLGLIAAAALTYGGYLAMQDEGTSLADVREQAGSKIASFNAGQSSPAAPAESPVAPSVPPIPPAPSAAPQEPAAEPPPVA